MILWFEIEGIKNRQGGREVGGGWGLIYHNIGFVVITIYTTIPQSPSGNTLKRICHKIFVQDSYACLLGHY